MILIKIILNHQKKFQKKNKLMKVNLKRNKKVVIKYKKK